MVVMIIFEGIMIGLRFFILGIVTVLDEGHIGHWFAVFAGCRFFLIFGRIGLLGLCLPRQFLDVLQHALAHLISRLEVLDDCRAIGEILTIIQKPVQIGQRRI